MGHKCVNLIRGPVSTTQFLISMQSESFLNLFSRSYLVDIGSFRLAVEIRVAEIGVVEASVLDIVERVEIEGHTEET